ncbi:MAG TPA: DUF2306 domain-containing protein [Kribbella sp.]|uniref:DUF2306 domain-containing protein n=1 Tax=Kribbella sp. TaxID=1871183 RepID=UPI002D7846AD|nr:DUF2306 domain-containing protein [Kribbella sp.]HET6294735.1 DUF2306 domain-containing protein [Kribbella sp.]
MAEVTLGRNKLRTAQVGIAFLAAIILVFAISRLINDVPHVVNGTIPEEDIDREYVAHPWIAYLHIGPAIVYLLGAPIQLAYRIRSKHYTFHRRLGRVLLVMGLLCGIFAVVFGAFFSFGGPWQAAASIVFGIWFLVCLVNAFRAIRRDDVVNHRRWMIRAYAIGIGVGTIRIWVYIFTAPDLLSFPDSFAAAFWISFALHAVFAEWWIRTTPHPPG